MPLDSALSNSPCTLLAHTARIQQLVVPTNAQLRPRLARTTDFHRYWQNKGQRPQRRCWPVWLGSVGEKTPRDDEDFS